MAKRKMTLKRWEGSKPDMKMDKSYKEGGPRDMRTDKGAVKKANAKKGRK